jgi:molybdopterin converting factor small subunit
VNDAGEIAITLQLHPVLERFRPRIGGADPVAVSVADQTTVENLLYGVCGLPRRIKTLVVVNGHQANLARVLEDGDVVRVFMPLSGG